MVYRPDPALAPPETGEVEGEAQQLPEDKLKAGMKERLVASLVAQHEQTEKRVDEIYR